MTQEMDGLLPDQRRMRTAFSAAATEYDSVAVLQSEVAKNMVERLDFVKQQPRRILDLGCGTGAVREMLKKRYPKAQIVGADLALSMVKQAQKHHSWFKRNRYLGVCADAHTLPFLDDTFDLVISNLMLQWCSDVQDVFADVRRVMRPGGLFMYSTMGPDTLKELRAAWAAVDDLPHVNLFLDMHDLGDAMVRSKMAEPVMDVQTMVLTYSRVAVLMSDLKRLGATNALKGRRRGLTGKNKLNAMINAYEQFRADGKLPATYEIFYGHAWSPQGPVNTQLESGAVAIPVSSIGKHEFRK